MRHVYNEDSSPSTPEAKEDIFQCLTVYSNPKFSLANLLPSRLVLERARLYPSYRHTLLNTFILKLQSMQTSNIYIYVYIYVSFFSAISHRLNAYRIFYLNLFNDLVERLKWDILCVLHYPDLERFPFREIHCFATVLSSMKY